MSSASPSWFWCLFKSMARAFQEGQVNWHRRNIWSMATHFRHGRWSRYGGMKLCYSFIDSNDEVTKGKSSRSILNALVGMKGTLSSNINQDSCKEACHFPDAKPGTKTYCGNDIPWLLYRETSPMANVIRPARSSFVTILGRTLRGHMVITKLSKAKVKKDSE